MSLPPPKILVVDDNRANLAAMRKLLGKLPCEVTLAGSGNEALAACIVSDFALIFLDVEMPGMNGYEVAELLKGEATTAHIPIVFATASHSDEAHRLRGYEAGAIDYIEKPVDDRLVLSKAAIFLDLYVSKQQLKLELERSEAMRVTARENEARYREALDGAPFPVMMHAEDGEVILVNRLWQEITGYAASALPTVEAWIAKAYAGQSEDKYRHVHAQFDIAGVVDEGESQVRTARGGELAWHFRTAPLGPLPDGRRLVVSMAEDVTAHRQAMRAHEEARQQAQQADRAKSEFLAMMSHEIRTPMNAIIGLSQLALEAELSPRQRNYLFKIKSSSSALLTIINDVLDYSKIEAGRLELEEVPFYLEETLRDMATLFMPAIERKNLELFVDIAPQTPLSLVGDSLRLGQVLNNLVGNAVKFTESGEIHLRIDLVESNEQQVMLKIQVRDTGIGLTAAQIEGLFRPFSQADGSITRRYGGTGLGLTISRHLVERMGGQISVTSIPGEGSTFSFTARLGVGVERRDMTLRHDMRGLKTLVVDDQETSRDILRAILEAWGCRVTTLSGGEEVVAEIQRAESSGHPFDIVLLDWQMPGVDGLEVAHRVEVAAADGRVRRPPMVIMVTAHSQEKLQSDVNTPHLDGFLAKPVTPSALSNAIAQLRTPSLVPPLDSRRAELTPYHMAAPICGASILVVEDNEINQEVAREFLEKAGLKVTIAADGRQAVDMVRKTRFDVILMDLQMPEMDGFEACRLIRALPDCAALPVIAMTAAALPRDKQACTEAGMNDHVSKPIMPKEMLATLLRWVPARAPSQRPALRSPGPVEEEAFPEIAGVDGRQASIRLAGNRTLFLSLLRQLIERNERAVESVRGELAAGRREEAARLLHGLRGAAGNVGAMTVAATASKAEAAIRDEQDNGVDELLRPLEEAMQALVSAVRAFATTPEPVAVAADPMAPLDETALRRLLAALVARDAEALDLFESLHSALRARHGQEMANRLQAALEGLHFEDAAGILIGLMSKT